MYRKAVLILLALLVALPVGGILPQGKADASPDTVTYYYEVMALNDGWTVWFNIADGNLATFAYTAGDGDFIRIWTTTSDGTDLGTITKVEIRCYGYGDGNDRIDLSFDATAPTTPEYQLTMPASEDWSAYADVTADTNVDGWTWAKVDDLFTAGSKRLVVEKDNVAGGGTMYCAKVEIRVTYTPVAPDLPTVTTQAATDIEDTTATGNGNITNTGGENCDIRGIVWDLASHGDPGDTSPAASDYANDVAETNSFGTGAFTRSLTGLPTGDTIYARAYAHNSAGYAYGDEVSFLTKPAAPTNVAATDGVHTDKVVVTWNKATGATGYKVYEGANLLDTLGDVATYDDTAAPAGSITSAGNVTASDGTETAHVILSLAGESTANGASRTYKVVAFNATGDSDDSATNAGYRGVGAITYQWQVDDGGGYDNIVGGTTDPYNYAGAPAGTISNAGTVTATDGTETAHVELSLAGEATADGAAYDYQCIVSSTGASNSPQTSDNNDGYRTIGAITYQWQVDDGGGYDNIAGGTTDPYNYAGAPAGTISDAGTVTASDGTQTAHVVLSLAGEATTDGATYDYQCIVSSVDASNTPQTSDNNDGYRGVGAITFQWQRSSADADADYSNIAGGTTDPYNDTGAPADGSGRYFQCIVSSVDASNTPQTSDSDRGYRAVPPAPPAVEALPIVTAVFFSGFVLLAVGLMGACYALKKPVLGFGAAGGWLMLGFYTYGFATELGDIYWGVRGAVFFFCIGMVFVSVFEAMGARGKREIGDDYEADDKRSEEEKDIDAMIAEAEESKGGR